MWGRGELKEEAEGKLLKNKITFFRCLPEVALFIPMLLMLTISYFY